MQQDILSDALSSIKNARQAGKSECIIEPTSNLIKNVLQVMQQKGYVGVFEEIEDGKGGKYKVTINTRLNDCSSIKPRFHVGKEEYTKYEKRFLPARQFGELIVTTPKGVMDHKQAQEEGVGGALLAFVY